MTPYEMAALYLEANYTEGECSHVYLSPTESELRLIFVRPDSQDRYPEAGRVYPFRFVPWPDIGIMVPITVAVLSSYDHTLWCDQGRPLPPGWAPAEILRPRGST